MHAVQFLISRRRLKHGPDPRSLTFRFLPRRPRHQEIRRDLPAIVLENGSDAVRPQAPDQPDQCEQRPKHQPPETSPLVMGRYNQCARNIVFLDDVREQCF